MHLCEFRLTACFWPSNSGPHPCERLLFLIFLSCLQFFVLWRTSGDLSSPVLAFLLLLYFSQVLFRQTYYWGIMDELSVSFFGNTSLCRIPHPLTFTIDIDYTHSPIHTFQFFRPVTKLSQVHVLFYFVIWAIPLIQLLLPTVRTKVNQQNQLTQGQIFSKMLMAVFLKEQQATHFFLSPKQFCLYAMYLNEFGWEVHRKEIPGYMLADWT